jgi:hypothetical protein
MLRPVLFAGVGAALMAGTASAYAGWSVPGTSTAVTLRSAMLPAGGTPVTTAAGSDVLISWSRVTIVAGVEVSGYRVVRSGGHGADHTVCETSTTSCTDGNAPNGTWTYTVRPVQGAWVGAPGPASDPVTVAHGNQTGATGHLLAAEARATPTPEATETASATTAPATTAPATTAPATTAPAEIVPPVGRDDPPPEPSPSESPTPSEPAPIESSSST